MLGILAIVAIVIIVILFHQFVYKVYIKPQLRIYSLKKKWGSQMNSYFHPIVGRYHLMGNRLSNRPQDLCYSDYIKDNDPKNPLKFTVSNMQDTVEFFLHDEQMQRDFLVNKTDYYLHIKNLPLQDKFMYKGLIFMRGEQHKLHRKILSEFFHFSALQNNIPVISNSGKKLIKSIKEFQAKNPKGGFEVTKNFKFFTGDAITSMFLGEKFKDTLVLGTPISYFICLLSHELMTVGFTSKFAQQRGAILGHQETDRTPEFLKTKAEKECYKKLEIMRNIILDEFKRRIETFEADSKKNKHHDLIHVYLKEYLSPQNQKLDDQDPLKITLEIILQQYITFLFAGTDTTATLLATSQFFLAKHPEIQEKIRKECKENIPDIENIQLSQIRKLTTLEAFFNEVLRHSSVVSILFYKVALKNHKLGDLDVKAGDLVNISIHGNHQNPLDFKNPGKFDITRWQNEKTAVPQNPFSFIAFSAGNKNCIGQHLAKLEAKIAMVQLLREFRVEFKDGDQEQVMDIPQLNQLRDDTIFKFAPL